jgi:hypothetical protein
MHFASIYLAVLERRSSLIMEPVPGWRVEEMNPGYQQAIFVQAFS